MSELQSYLVPNAPLNEAIYAIHNDDVADMMSSIWLQITPQIDKIERLKDQISHLRSEIEMLRAGRTHEDSMADILGRIKMMQSGAPLK